MKLGEFVLSLWDDAVRMRKQGVSREDVQRGLHSSLITYARERGLIVSDEDVPRWQLRGCVLCADGWQVTTRLVRGVSVEAYRRCPCRPVAGQPDRKAAAAEKVAGGWSR